MKAENFTTRFMVDKTPMQIFDAINNVRGWWSEAVEGGTENLNDEFVYRHKDIHYSKQKLVETVPGKKVVWLVTDSRLNFIKQKDEWTGTRIVFEIIPAGNKTELQVTHEGLTPGVECFDACSNAWTFYLNSSLLKLAATGKGEPDEKLGTEKVNA